MAMDEDGRILVWTGDVAAPPPPAAVPVSAQTRPPNTGLRAYTPAHLAEKIGECEKTERDGIWSPHTHEEAIGFLAKIVSTPIRASTALFVASNGSNARRVATLLW